MSSKTIALTYLEAISRGGIQYNKHLYTTDFEYQNTANDQVSHRTAYLNFLRENKGIKYDCKTTYEILDESGTSAIGRASMTFQNFTRVDYITIIQTKDGWKISKVVTTYP